ncbi:hypothetical protein J7F01_12275 [Streptomyces sp. ISL-22]|uniref:hypothetical protein n=1 Tax=unclassified Streptomyces TaxID=2593676 RepID=UPI001BE8200E|nr:MULTISPECIES: hypothetical protein [unclassified Streptomyces]MBT2418631.1 hypothetical protein [Streptomyces sp. ISL-24]MBT2432957.1 hypothetical protein [Streptomyces sp. ISL-22]
MSDLPGLEQATVDAILAHAARATLPFQRAHRPGPYATAFWFNDLVGHDGDTELVRQYLVTAAEPTRMDLAEVTLRPQLGDPAPTAGKLLMTDFADGWTHLDNVGVAVQPAAGLHAYARRKGWTWTTDEITDGIAARAQDIARIGGDPMRAYVLGHDVGEGGERSQMVAVGALARATDESVRWGGELPEGCVGAPVFLGLPQEGDSFKLVCAGVTLPPDDHGFGRHRVATFDQIRDSLRTTAPTTPSTPAERPRRWWRRRG